MYQRSIPRGYSRPALKRDDDPVFWDAHQARIAKSQADAAQHDPSHWPQTRQVALLLMTHSAIALDCVVHLRGSLKHPSQDDFAWLRQHGYAVRNLGERYHTLTADGRRAADDCAAVVGKTLGLHHIRYDFDSWNEHKAHCCCGWSASADRRSGNPRAPLSAAASRHLDDPQAWIRANDRTRAIIDNAFGGKQP